MGRRGILDFWAIDLDAGSNERTVFSSGAGSRLETFAPALSAARFDAAVFFALTVFDGAADGGAVSSETVLIDAEAAADFFLVEIDSFAGNLPGSLDSGCGAAGFFLAAFADVSFSCGAVFTVGIFVEALALTDDDRPRDDALATFFFDDVFFGFMTDVLGKNQVASAGRDYGRGLNGATGISPRDAHEMNSAGCRSIGIFEQLPTFNIERPISNRAATRT